MPLQHRNSRMLQNSTGYISEENRKEEAGEMREREVGVNAKLQRGKDHHTALPSLTIEAHGLTTSFGSQGPRVKGCYRKPSSGPCILKI